MTLLVVGFLFMLVLTFSLVALATRPSKAEKTLDKRLVAIGNASQNLGRANANARPLLLSRSGNRAPWLADLLEDNRFVRRMETTIAQAYSKTSLEALVAQTLGAAVAAFLVFYLFWSTFFVAIPAAILAGSIPYAFIAYKRAKRIRAFNAELPNAADMMSRALRAGHSVVGAIEILAEQTTEPAATEFAEVFRQQNFGLPLREALIQMMDRVPSQDLRVLVTAIIVQRDTGGNLGDILDRTVFVIRERVRIQGDIRTQTAQGRLTGYILSGLPFFMLFAINLINPGYSRILLEDPFGRELIYIGLVLIVLGFFTIRHMINRIEV